MANRRAGRVVARLGVLVESSNLLSLGDVSFDAACTRVLVALGAHLNAEATIAWADRATAGGRGEATVSSPIAIGERQLGRLVVRRSGRAPGTARSFDEDDLRLVQDVAALVAGAWVLRELPSVACTRAVLDSDFDDAPIGVLLIGVDGILLRANRAFAELVDRTPLEVEGRPWLDLVVPAHEPEPQYWSCPAPSAAAHRLVHQRYRRRDGSTVRAHVVLDTVLPDGPSHPERRVLLALVLNATDELDTPGERNERGERDELGKRDELERDELERDELERDEMTGVATRQAAFARLSHALDRLADRAGPGAGRGLAVAVVDLDHFTALNAAYGHETGDKALREIAQALRRAGRPGDLVGRLGGDEFILVFDDVTAGQADALAAEVAAALDAVSTDLGDGLRGRVGGSIGLAWSDRALDVREFVARAQRGVREAKRHGRGRVWRDVGDRRQQAEDSAGSVTARELQRAIDHGEFELYYQPIVDSEGHRLRAVEALLRWNHPSGRLLTPAHFLRELLESGQINTVGQWALQQAIAHLANWRASTDGADLVLNLNISPAELADAEWATLLSKAIADAGVSPESICVELTEQAMVGTVVSRSGLHRLASTGTRLALDDFGTGVSSLSHLRVRPLHGIKIDRSFIAGVGNASDDRHIVRALIEMACGLGLEVTAEGVETAEQARWLTDAGCHLLQGWQFSRAVDADAIGKMVAAQRV